MDLQLILEHLAEAERHVALSDKHIARQIEIIDGLERAGCSTDLAIDLLAPTKRSGSPTLPTGI